MKFRKKVFLSTFATSALLLILLAGSVEELLRNAVETLYLNHYSSISQVIGDTLRQMEAATVMISSGSARVLFDLTRQGSIPSEQGLKEVRASLGISQMAITDKNGRILRDTETPPNQRTLTLFDFCAGYRNLLRDSGRIETTPILPSYPTGKAYIFSMMANSHQSGIVEAGIHINFIVETLAKAMVSDPNISSIGLYTPKGIPLGFISEGTGTPTTAAPLPDLSIGSRRLGHDRLAIVTKVPASTESCCECSQKNLTLADGKYYYLLRTEVTLAPLYANLRSLQIRALAICLAALLLAFLLSRWVAKLLVRRLDLFGAGVSKLRDSGDLSLRLKIKGSDEIADLAATFDEVTLELDRTQRAAIRAEKSRALAAVAKQVAHDIRSPLAALRAATQHFSNDPENEKKLIRAAVGRIQEIAENLLARYREGSLDAPEEINSQAQIGLLQLVEGALAEKRAELGPHTPVTLEFEPDPSAFDLFVRVAPSDLKRVLSNLLNNAIEAFAAEGQVSLLLSAQAELAKLEISDNGKGIPPDLLPQLMQSGATHGKPSGMGLGLAHAREIVEGCGGNISLQSNPGIGTKVTIELPRVPAPVWYPKEICYAPGQLIMIIDDDQSIHRIWKSRFDPENSGGPRLLHCFGTEELTKQHEKLLQDLNPPGNPLYFIDQELTGSPESGLEAILRLGIESASILVTSHADDSQLAHRCLAAGIRLLPKNLVGWIPVRKVLPIDA